MTSSDERESYRKAVMFEETGKRHLADLDRTGDFDKVMARFAADADDYEAAGNRNDVTSHCTATLTAAADSPIIRPCVPPSTPMCHKGRSP